MCARHLPRDPNLDLYFDHIRSLDEDGQLAARAPPSAWEAVNRAARELPRRADPHRIWSGQSSKAI
jgi:hypothetical protein